MKKILFTAATLLALIQIKAQTVTDSSIFKSRKLKIEEINLVSSYYKQDGNNAAVTGGIGSEKLTDISNIIDVKLVRYNNKQHKQVVDVEVGIDHYTSASSDRVDMKANSSASASDTRIYPSVNFTTENENKGTTFGIGASSSYEYDYTSFGGNVSYAKKTVDKNGEFTAKFSTYLDKVDIIKPTELRGSGDFNNPTKARNTFAATLSYSQIINERLNVMLIADAIQQNGYLSLPFHRVFYNTGVVAQENLPTKRNKLPLGVRANYFLGDKFIIKTFYRFYTDNWGIKSHTANIELPIKITPFVSVSPFFRYYTQTASTYFAPYLTHTVGTKFITSNYDFSGFNTSFFGTGLRLAPPKGIFGLKHITMLELRYGHYSRTTGLNANIISINIKFK